MGQRHRDYQDQLEDEFKGCRNNVQNSESFDDRLAEPERKNEMTAFLKGRAITQTDKLLINGKEYTEKELKEIIKEHEVEKNTNGKTKNSG